MWAFFADLLARLLTAIGLYESGQINAKNSALAAAEAETIKNLQKAKEIDDVVNADPDLVARARAVGVSSGPGK